MAGVYYCYRVRNDQASKVRLSLSFYRAFLLTLTRRIFSRVATSSSYSTSFQRRTRVDSARLQNANIWRDRYNETGKDADPCASEECLQCSMEYVATTYAGHV